MSSPSESRLEPPQIDSALNYATPKRPAMSQSWAASLIVLTGLALIGLGGCFLIGVMMLLADQFFWGMHPIVWTPAVYVLLIMLFVLALVCFLGAGLILPAGIRGLLRILSGRQP